MSEENKSNEGKKTTGHSKPSVYKVDNDKRRTSPLSSVAKQEQFIEKLVENNFNIKKTTKDLDIPISTVYYKMNNDKDFHDRVKGNKKFMKVMIKNTIMEMLMSSDMTVKNNALDKLAKSDLLGRLLDMEDVNQNINLNINKDDLKLGE